MSPYNARKIKQVGGWALSSDGVQWILEYEHGHGGHWEGKCFVSSDRYILECRMMEHSVPKPVRDELVWGLPETFDEWLSGEPQAKYRDTPLKARRYLKHLSEKDPAHVRSPKQGQYRRIPRRGQSTSQRAPRR